ncbi:MAG: hypothetical protein K1X72_07565 [Pyrinomonadaceae bacterium]|nr:hypothetical protein [Pyrinomonadaceae bacterium]
MSLIKKHLSAEILINLADKTLSNDELKSANDHLKDCPKCSAEANKFSEIVGLMQRDTSTDAPQDSIVWAKNLFATRLVEPKKSLLQKVLAVLEIDFSKQPVFGERSAAPVKQMLYRAEDLGISLRISNENENISLRGQVLGEKFGNCEIVLKSEKNSFFATANEASEFNLQEIPNGIYDLTLSNDEKEVIIENLELN